MTNEDLCKEVISSSLKDEVKFEIIKKLLAKEPEITYIKEPEMIYIPTTQPSKDYYITYGDDTTPRTEPEVWNDGDWWQQHLRDAQGDVESIIHPLFSW